MVGRMNNLSTTMGKVTHGSTLSLSGKSLHDSMEAPTPFGFIWGLFNRKLDQCHRAVGQIGLPSFPKTNRRSKGEIPRSTVDGRIHFAPPKNPWCPDHEKWDFNHGFTVVQWGAGFSPSTASQKWGINPGRSTTTLGHVLDHAGSQPLLSEVLALSRDHLPASKSSQRAKDHAAKQRRKPAHKQGT